MNVTTGGGNKHGFTLVELMIVVVIMGILFGLLTIAIRFARENGKTARYKSDKATIAAAVRAYRHEYGRWPIDESSAWQLNPPVATVTNTQADLLFYFQNTGVGKNERNVTFMNFDEYKRDGGGNLLDPWGHRYTVVIDLAKDTVTVQ